MYVLASLGAPPLLRGRRGTMCSAKGSDVRPGVPWAPPLLRGRRGTMCIAKGSDVLTHSLMQDGWIVDG